MSDEVRQNLAGLLQEGSTAARTYDLLNFMARHGQSVLVGWGEDDSHWECSWITSGERFTAHSVHLRHAVETVARKVVARLAGVPAGAPGEG